MINETLRSCVMEGAYEVRAFLDENQWDIVHQRLFVGLVVQG